MNGAGHLLRVDDLSVHAGARPLLRDVSFALSAGQCLTLLGESGAGKSLLAQAVMGNLSPGLRAGGAVQIGAHTSAASAGGARRPLWGRELALLPQEPMLSLDPLMRIGPQLSEVHALVRNLPAHEAARAAASGLAEAGLAAAERKYPWQLSGGMAQRAAAAIALAGGAPVLIVDEPTKGLDAAWRDRTVAFLQDVLRRGGCVVAITHDLRVARALGGRVIVLREGEAVEAGDAARVLDHPQHAFTRLLVDADPSRWARRPAQPIGELVVAGRAMRKRFGDLTVLDDVDMALHRGERLVVQGPSGSGKSTLGNALLGLLPLDAGQVDRARDLPRWGMQKLYQDPVSSFPPHASLEEALRDVARLHGRSWSGIERRLADLRVAPDVIRRRPAQVSGGELQRVALTRALAAEPALLFADEPTSRLDPVTQKEAMEVLLDTVDFLNAALLLVTHDEDIAHVVATRQSRPWAQAPA